MKYWFLIGLLLVGCTTELNFEGHMNDVYFPHAYKVQDTLAGKMISYTVQNEEPACQGCNQEQVHTMQEIIAKVKNSNMAPGTEQNGISCFKSTTATVCFDDNNAVVRYESASETWTASY